MEFEEQASYAAERRVTPCSHGGNEQPQRRGYRSDNEQVQGFDKDYEGGECRKLTMVGILTRGDENEYLESKRIGLNQRLSELCARNGVEFVDPSGVYDTINAGRLAQERRRIETRVLDRWGLHLNEWGRSKWPGYCSSTVLSF